MSYCIWPLRNEDINQWRSKGSKVRACAPGRRPCGASTHLFLSRKLDQNVSKNVKIFLEKKAVKIAAASGALPPDPRVVTPAKLLQHFVECVSSVKRVLLRLKKNICNISTKQMFYICFCAYFFISRLCSFVDGGAKIFFAPERRAP